jgi:REP element-mobilizing transposase RayT
VDWPDFLKTLAEACQKTGFEVPASGLMRNPFQLVVETPNGNLVAGMRWLLSRYTLRLNHRCQRCGHVFSGRYQALVVEGSGQGYLKTVCDEVHLNPVRARLLGAEDRLLSYPWSSFGYYLAAPEHRPGWLRVDRLLGEQGLAADTAAGRQELERRMEGKLGEHHAGGLRRERAEARGERLIGEELGRLGWTEVDLAGRAKSDPDKVALATRLRRETTLTIKAIAHRLHLGTWKSATTRLQIRKRKENHPGQVQML